jgi:hypothetical protein
MGKNTTVGTIPKSNIHLTSYIKNMCIEVYGES